MKVVHSWLKEYVGEALPDAKTVDRLLTFHAFEMEGIEEVGDETVLEVDVLPNRASDSLSHRGIAREIATILDINFKNDPLESTVEMEEGTKVTLTVDDAQLCNRFTAAVITDVKVGPTPDWLKTRLGALGQRSINNVVDATNYVMFAIGQPTHVFDFDKLQKDSAGRVNIVVRNGREGETLELLGGETIASSEQTLHLVDGNSDTLLDLAGIKGGTPAEFTADSVNLVVTSGNFNYQSVRKTAQRTKVFTEASQRFQNQPSERLAAYGLEMVVKMILELAGGNCDGMVDSYQLESNNPQVTVTVQKTNSLLGLSLTTQEIADALTRTGSTVILEEDIVKATGPWERTDLNIEEDFIEEVGRIYGLDKIAAIIPETVSLKEINVRHYYSDRIRSILTGLGFSEVITSSFHKKGKIQLRNALASDKSYVRGNLRKNIEQVLDKNFVHNDLLGTSDVRVFEIGTVFSPGEGKINEHVSLALGVRTKGNGYSGKDDQALEEAQYTLNHELGITIDWDNEKGIAETDFTKLLGKLPVPEAYEAVAETPDVQFKTPSPYPAISRDIALWVAEEVEASIVQKVLAAAAGDLLVRIDPFDTFTKDNRTSYAFRLVFQSYKKTLTDEEVNVIMEAVNEKAVSNDWEVR